MSKKSKHDLISSLMYSFIIYALFFYFITWLVLIPISLVLGFLFGILNSILTELKINNGESFPNLKEKLTEELKRRGSSYR